MRAAIYCRVSTREQAEGTSLDTQEQACIDRAGTLGYEVIDVVREDHTGTSPPTQRIPLAAHWQSA